MIVVVCGAGLVGWFYGDWPLGLGASLVAWLFHSWAYPWTTCEACKGNPRNLDKSGANWNVYCPRCGGSGKRRRLGSYLLRRGFGNF